MTPELQRKIAKEKAETFRARQAEWGEIVRRAPEKARRWHWRYHVETRTECAGLEYQIAKWTFAARFRDE